jgi:hypothetical protein
MDVLAIDEDGDPVLLLPDRSQLAVKRSAVVAVVKPPKLPIGTRAKLTVTVDKRIDGQTGKVIGVLTPTIRRVRWMVEKEAIERHFQLSYLAEVAA